MNLTVHAHVSTGDTVTARVTDNGAWIVVGEITLYFKDAKHARTFLSHASGAVERARMRMGWGSAPPRTRTSW